MRDHSNTLLFGNPTAQSGKAQAHLERALKGLVDRVTDRRAEGDDGFLELVPMQGRRDWVSKAMRDLAVLPLFQEDLDIFGVTHSVGFKGAVFDLEFERPRKAEIQTQLDGEEWIGGARFSVQVSRNALPFITPAEFDPPWRFQ